MSLSSKEPRPILEEPPLGRLDQQPVAGQASRKRKISWSKTTAIYAFFQYLLGKRTEDEDCF